jgi:nitroimidazol reductase NimA-like FMN-containing flavoprotein (pyridoxamine 5'-phosphate oxidase superfamily)
MTGPEPKSASLIAADASTALPWEVVRDLLKDARLYWLATVHPTGRPHVRPVLAVWVDGALYSTSTRTSRKGQNLTADPAARSRPGPTPWMWSSRVSRRR